MTGKMTIECNWQLIENKIIIIKPPTHNKLFAFLHTKPNHIKNVIRLLFKQQYRQSKCDPIANLWMERLKLRRI